ncbi:MAG: ABC transporter ATP-binding protein [Pseudomonadota bacterium]
MLDCEELNVRIDGKHLLNKISWEVKPGKVNAIIGLNGAGKSTLINAMAGQCPVDGGCVRLNGQPLLRFSACDRARQIALVTQHTDTPSALSVQEVLALGCLPPLGSASLHLPAVRESVEQISESFALTALLGRPMNRLSGGEQRRVLLAQAWAQATPIILLDEPTNHLDTAQQLALMDRLTDSDKTLVMALHDVNLARLYSDFLLVLEHGSVLIAGPTAEVLNTQLLDRLYSRRFIGLDHRHLATQWFAPVTVAQGDDVTCA